MKKCAICYKDPITSHWKNPTGGRAEPQGTSESNWACDTCLGKKQNRGWRNTPSEEVYGLESEEEVASVPVPSSEPGPFETPQSIEIMRRYCLGQTQRAIASDVETSHSVVKRTIRYWKTHYGYFLKMLKKSLDKTGSVIQ
jgi:hypothetical protein